MPSISIPPTSVPNAARIYDYTLGGQCNVEADRQAAEYMFSLVPSTQKWVRMLRDFLQEVALDLYEQGFRQFLDLGSGLPTQDHIHHVLPADARVIYVDREDLTVQYGQALVADVENAQYIQGDVRHLDKILNAPAVRDTFDMQEPIAIGLNGLVVFLLPDEIQQMMKELHRWAPTGSRAYITYETKEIGKSTPAWDQFVEMFAQAGSPFYILSLEEYMDLMAPWRTIRIEPLADYLGRPADFITEADHEGVGVEFYAALLGKQGE